MENIVAKIQELMATYGFKVLGAIAILVIGWLAAKLIRDIMIKLMGKAHLDEALVSFIGSLSYVAMMVFVVVAALNSLGVQTASFIAVIGAATLAIGLALQGSLANFASGVLIIIFKPFKSGDFIEAAGVSGVVKHIEIFTTTLTSPDNKKVIVPNGSLMAGNIVNYTALGTRRVDMTIGVSYGDDLDKVIRVINEVLQTEGRILPEPAPQVAVKEMAESSINLVVRPWVKVADYWSVLFAMQKAIKQRFDAEGITIPFPQRDVHLFHHDKPE